MGLRTYPYLSWCSIVSARGLLEKGLDWQIGDGHSVNIWDDPWIPRSVDGCIHYQSIDIRYTTVSQSINHDTSTWERDVVASITDECQSKDIFTIPLPKCSFPDTKIWRLEGSGLYFVRSSYKALAKEASALHHGHPFPTDAIIQKIFTTL